MKPLLSVLVPFLSLASLSHGQLTLLSNISANQPGGTSAGEIAAFDPITDRLFGTSSGGAVHRINIFNFANPSAPTALGTVDFSDTFGAASNMLGLSSVAVDPLGRFGAVALIPAANTTTLGRVGFFNLSTGAVIGSIEAGFHPDSLTFSKDGSRLVVVNEGELAPTSSTNAPGSISVINLSSVTAGNAASTLPALTAITRDFSTPNLASGVTLSGIRNSSLPALGTAGAFIAAVPNFTNPANIQFEGMEPEYATIQGDKVYVSLQENNAIAEYDLNTNLWTNVTNLGSFDLVIDASDRDGPSASNAILINKSVKGLPMPDAVDSYVVGGKTYIVSANEGDARPDDPSRDLSRFGDTGGNDDMNPILDLTAFPNTATGVRADAQLGRLNISRLDGDSNGDGKIDTPTTIGTRSFTIWEKTATGLVKAWDSGSAFEQYIRDFDASGWVDSRSDDKGPEPEGLTVGNIDGRWFAFIGMERTGHIFMFDITDPNAPFFFGAQRVVAGTETPLRPESLAFISAADSPTGQNLLVVGYEGDGTLASSERLVTFAVVPEPSVVLLVIAGLSAVLWFRRRRVS